MYKRVSFSVGGCAGNPCLEAEESRASELALHWPTAAPRGFVWNRSLRFLLYFRKSFFKDKMTAAKIFEPYSSGDSVFFMKLFFHMVKTIIYWLTKSL